jgi:predicted nucleotide-binding protein (sugar kinase/HSP70/actin superfamily)
MCALRHQHVTRKVGADNPLYGKVVYLPAMSEGHPEAFAAVFRWLGVEAHPTPSSDARTRELGGKFTAGDECYPAKVTVGDFLRIMEQPGFDPKRTVFFMAAADGPCRFGQYAPYLKRLLSEVGHGEVQILSPSSRNGYADIGDIAAPFMRAAWRALVCGDLLHKTLLQTRPYEDISGAADRVFQECTRDLCQTIEASCADPDCQLRDLVDSMQRSRERFRRLPAHYDPETPLVGVVEHLQQ